MKTSLFLICLLGLSLPLLAQRLSPFPDSMQNVLTQYQQLSPQHRFKPITADEPGRPLLLMVEIWGRDCDCPLPETAVFMTQTSDAGVYDLSIAGDWASARLKGSIQTDPKGRYLIESILPGTYPNSPTANPHIHLMLESLSQPYYNILFQPYLNWYGRRTLVKRGEQHFAADIWQGPRNQLIGYVRIYVKS
ncbi:MAG: hypothetical protein AAFN10_24605 [Bacteroidota bacterium]